MPKINWSKYDIKPVKEVSSNESSDENNKQITTSNINSDNGKTNSGPIRVRGRVYDQSKPETFNQVIFTLTLLN